MEDVTIECDSFSADVLIKPIPLVLSERPITEDVIERELGVEEDLETGIRAHSSVHGTEQNLYPSNFVMAYQSPQPRPVLVLCDVDKAGTSFILQVLALFVIGFIVMPIYAVKKMILEQEQAFGYATYRKVFPPDEDDSGEHELELREVSRLSA
jgi:hypothetical protein